MLSNEVRMSLDKGWTTILIIWAAMLFSLLVYAVVGYVVKENAVMGMNEEFPLDILRNILFGISLLTIGAIWYLRKLLLQKLFSPNTTGTSFSAASGSVTGQHPVVQRYLVVILVSTAMAESIGIYGLLLCLLGGQMMDLIILIMLSAFAMLIFRPRKDELESLMMTVSRPSL